MPGIRSTHPPSLKATVATEAIRAQKTVIELAQLHNVNPNLVTKWKKQALDSLPGIFQQPHKAGAAVEAEKEELYRHICQMKVELDWLKKKAGL